MLTPKERESLEREWTAIHAEMERLTHHRPPADPLAPVPEPTDHEQNLLGRLDEIEYLLGLDDREIRRKCRSNKDLHTIESIVGAQELRDKKT